ncbi:arginase family protein [Rhizobium sp. P38BS-XIX]|uniref:arginase family protein n=1 Tax=Rhizobium sp. P38BS-XIX TaxID=2726740 RepID=UPI0014570EB0|nr:arginase family protein [Rhizobium sp. P38BS-XIX]NLR99829.1 arginase family protein [Rhizobium sp. P38BS-XIX]
MLNYELILSQGRIADRTPGAIAGAALTAEAIAKLTGLTPIAVGTPSPSRLDDWSTSLPDAQETLTSLRNAVATALQRGRKPLMVANTCSASLASLPVAFAHHPDAVLLWIDAHGDFNTPRTTQSGYLGGMVLAAACGLWDSGHGQGIDPIRVVIVGARDIDAAEEQLLTQSGVHVISPADANPEAIRSAIGDAPVWIHVDWDVLEPNYVPAAYAIPAGLHPDSLRAIFRALPAEQIVGIELAEFEASGNNIEDASALAVIIDVISPVIDAN